MSITEETLSQEFSRLVEEYRSAPVGSNGAEAWNLIADFSVANSTTISAALEAAMSSAPTPPATAVSEVSELAGWGPTSTERAMRQAGQVAIDELIDRMDGNHPGNDDLADYMTRIVDACVRAALAPVPAREPIAWTNQVQIDAQKLYPRAGYTMWGVKRADDDIALFAAPVPAREAVKVKAPEWSTDGAGLWQATCPHTYLNYAVLTRSSGLVEWRGSFDWHDALSIEAGKRCAQSDHEQRVLSALFRTTEEEG